MIALSKFFGNFLHKATSVAHVDVPTLTPFDGPVYVIGDIHGCLAEYQEILSLIAQDAQQLSADATIVLLGDIVDRGAQTAALIDHLIAQRRKGVRLICLRGNHEEMMLSFLEHPKQHLDWLDFGGYETLASYGLFIDMSRLPRISARTLSQMIAAHIPEQHIRFLNKTVAAVRVGDFLLAHAGADIRSPLSHQSARALMWGDAGQKAPDGLTLVHGHYIVPDPSENLDCISIDTGAYLTGKLTCVRLMQGRRPAVATTKLSAQFTEFAPKNND